MAKPRPGAAPEAGLNRHDLGRRDNEKGSGEAHSPGRMVRRQVGNVPAGWMEDTAQAPHRCRRGAFGRVISRRCGVTTVG